MGQATMRAMPRARRYLGLEGGTYMWRYEQSTGRLTSPWGSPFGKGYSGNGDGVNNSKMEAVHNVGPIPRGRYSIGDAQTVQGRGDFVMALTPCDETNTFGRGGFLIHGDLIAEPGKENASHGCIILNRLTRTALAASSDRELEVY